MTTRLIIVLYLTSLIPVMSGATMFCKTCHSVHDPAHCHVIESCREGYCAMEVYQLNGTRTYTYSCKEHHSCEHQLIGKRGPGPHHEEGILLCKQCCQYTGCEKHLCQDYLPTTMTHRYTTTDSPTTTPSPITTRPASTCLNLESSDFRCADLDQFHFCSDVNSSLHSVAKERCPLHCGFCVLPSTACEDVEDRQFRCSDWKALGNCALGTDPGYQVSRLKCRKTCDLCDV
ncbi:uncharacterized protein LOC127847070 isoform X2 [Dreissena polymorpha]|uniref:uncharacterized protein LOC127847070 isoform X2 n=1 Tax=Dreissena polymorpha TaxID=45954 RepID=UPI002264E642|nr:uncharacterized protein LOC127847070 isoform X2 [Dreissena polymorpha]